MARDPEAFPVLGADELTLARSCGTLETFASGESLFPVGERDVDFFVIGAMPCTDFLGSDVCKDDKGFLLAGADSTICGHWPLTTRQPCALETWLSGVFVAGDCRSKTAKRVAVGDGALAVNCVHDFLGTYN